jgi:hypothetical protein
MPLSKTIKASNYSIYIWKITESLHDLASGLPGNIKEQIIKVNKLQKRIIEKTAQANLLIEAEYDPLLLSYNPSGKPFIRKSSNYISFSHSGEYAVLMVSHSNCGIDIEKDNPKIKRISPKFLNESESCFLSQPGAINWIWCIKEAVFKYFGERVIFKDDILIDRLNIDQQTARVIYQGFYGTGIFEINLMSIGNYYLAFTKAYQST